MFFEIYFFCHKNMFNNMYNSKINNVLWEKFAGNKTIIYN